MKTMTRATFHRGLRALSAAGALFLSAGTGLSHETGRLEYFDFSVASDLGALSLKGSAVLTEDFRCRLTPADDGQSGALWHVNKQRLDQGFQLVFRYQTSAPGGFDDPDYTDGGDGLAFVIQANGPDELGGGGGDMGYAGITNSLAVEFDMWNNGDTGGENDPDSSHVAVQTRGSAPNSHMLDGNVALASTAVQLDDGEVHTVRIDYIPGNLRVFVDDLQTPVLSAPVDLSSLAASEGNPTGDNILDDGGQAYIGFTAGTGSVLQNHDILYFVLRTGEPCLLDYDGSNQINPDDLGDFINDYFTVPPVPGPGGFAVACPENAPPYDLGYKVAFTGSCDEPMSDVLGDFITAYFDGCEPAE